MFAYFMPDRLNELKRFFTDTRTKYDDELRTLLFEGVDFDFYSQLRSFRNDAYQLAGDLDALNRVPRLADGSVPFEIWLKNAADLFSSREEAKVFSKALDELARQSRNAPPIDEPRRVPVVREAIVHRNDMVSPGFLASGMKAAASVARLGVRRYDGERPAFLPGGVPTLYQGTGWLFAPGLLMTNHHVVNARNQGEPPASAGELELQVRDTVVQFDYDAKEARGSQSPGSPRLEAFDAELDYAVLRLPEADGRAPLALSPVKVEVKEDSYLPVNIIQHPYGGPKMVALRNNLAYDSDYPRLRYFTDTEHGSSGSPVFDDNWKVIALHHAATFVEGLLFQGRTTGWVNQGTQMAAVLEHLGRHSPEVIESIAGRRPAPVRAAE